MTPNDMFLAQASYSISAIWLIQKLKACSKIPWINQNTDKINRAVAVVLSFITAVGVQWTVQGSVSTGGVLTVTFPAADVMIEAAIRWFQSYALQEGMYNMYKALKGGK